MDEKKPDRAPKPARPGQKLLTLSQAKIELGMPYSSVRDLVARGSLPAVRFDGGKRIWIKRSDLDRLIETSTERAS